jgi:hypothetical protein
MGRKHPVRAAMDRALRQVVVSDLRARGFVGRFPHFRRHRATRLDLLTFQFSQFGGRFVVEIGSCAPDGLRTPFRVVPHKVTAWSLDLLERLRLGTSATKSDYWFKFGSRDYEPSNPLRSDAYYHRVATRVLKLLDSQAEPHWRRRRRLTRR